MANQDSTVATAPRHIPRVAANPIPYWARDGKVDKSKEVFDQARVLNPSKDHSSCPSVRIIRGTYLSGAGDLRLPLGGILGLIQGVRAPYLPHLLRVRAINVNPSRVRLHRLRPLLA
jgi:hypothetical protein